LEDKEIFGTSMHANDENKKTACKGDLFIAIDVSKFTDINSFKSRVTRLTEEIKSSKTIDNSPIYIPGERAHKNKDRLIEIDDKLYDEIIKL
jgi:LDH2 family malate/lactate/ureidoglycolate dehydrogenase